MTMTRNTAKDFFIEFLLFYWDCAPVLHILPQSHLSFVLLGYFKYPGFEYHTVLLMEQAKILLQILMRQSHKKES